MAKRPPRAPPKKDAALPQLLKDYGPAAALVISVASFAFTLQVQAENNARENVRAEIYFEAASPPEWCKQAQSAEAVGVCGMAIKPADPAMRLLRTMVQYPASEFPDGRRTYDETYGGTFVLSLSKRTTFLSNRSKIIHNIKGDNSNITGVLPITILSHYTYNGKKYWDASAYNVHYAIADIGGQKVAVPANLTYCGRLQEKWATFLVDPWLPSVIGFPDQKSTGVLFECMGKANWFSIERGRYVVVSDLAAKVRMKPPPLGTIPYDVRSVTTAPVGKAGPIHTSQLVLQ